MTIDELMAVFNDENTDEFLKFERVPSERRKSNRPDLHAFIVLDSLVPSTTDIVCAAEHDEIYLGVDINALAEVVDEQTAIDLVRCGVRLDEYDEGLCMFV